MTSVKRTVCKLSQMILFFKDMKLDFFFQCVNVHKKGHWDSGKFQVYTNKIVILDPQLQIVGSGVQIQSGSLDHFHLIAPRATWPSLASSLTCAESPKTGVKIDILISVMLLCML